MYKTRQNFSFRNTQTLQNKTLTTEHKYEFRSAMFIYDVNKPLRRKITTSATLQHTTAAALLTCELFG